MTKKVHETTTFLPVTLQSMHYLVIYARCGEILFKLQLHCKFTKESSSEKKFENRLRLDHIMAMSLWTYIFGPPGKVLQSTTGTIWLSSSISIVDKDQWEGPGAYS